LKENEADEKVCDPYGKGESHTVDRMGDLQFRDSPTDDIAETAYENGINKIGVGSATMNTHMERRDFWNDDERDRSKPNGKRPARKIKTRSRLSIVTHMTKVVIAMLVTVTHPESRP